MEKNSKKRRIVPSNFVDLPTAINETLAVDIMAVPTNEREREVYTVEVTGPFDGSPGKFTAKISNRDVENFFKFRSIMLRWVVNDKNMGHALCLMRNTCTNTCEIFDPNGSIEFTNDKLASEFMNAVHKGLLRPLISPAAASPDRPFAVNFVQRELPALQDKERDLSEAALTIIEIVQYSSVPELLTPIFRSKNDTFGFCVAWTAFRQIDEYRNSSRFFIFMDRAIDHMHPKKPELVSPETFLFLRAAKNVWFEEFKLALGEELLYSPRWENLSLAEAKEAVTKILEEEWVSKTFSLLTVPLFIRMLSVFFVKTNESNLKHTGNQQNIVNMQWPVWQGPGDLGNCLHTLLLMYKSKTHQGIGLLPNPRTFERIMYLTGESTFPYPAATADQKPIKQWTVSVDTSRPVQSTKVHIIE